MDFTTVTKSISDGIQKWEPLLKNLSSDIIYERKKVQNRTIRQIPGHLCDSASNNASSLDNEWNSDSEYGNVKLSDLIMDYVRHFDLHLKEIEELIG